MTSNEHTIQFPKFDGKNYSQWKFRMDLLLEEKQLKIFVESTLDDAIKNNKNPGIKEEDMRVREKKCKSLIAQAINDEQLQYVMDKQSAKEMYDALVAMFQRKSITSQLILRRSLLTMKFNGDDINDHFAQFDKLIRELKLAGAQLVDMDVIVNLFLTLPKSYDGVVSSLESMDETKLTLDYVKGRLLDSLKGTVVYRNRNRIRHVQCKRKIRISFAINVEKRGTSSHDVNRGKRRKRILDRERIQVPIVLRKKKKKERRYCVAFRVIEQRH